MKSEDYAMLKARIMDKATKDKIKLKFYLRVIFICSFDNYRCHTVLSTLRSPLFCVVFSASKMRILRREIRECK